MKKSYTNTGVSQRQLRVGEMIKHSIGEIFIRNEAKIDKFDTKKITITEVKMSSELKSARVYVIPLGGKDTKEAVNVLTECNHVVRKALSKKIVTKFLPKLFFVEDKSFDYAEKIERLIKQNNNERRRNKYN